ncbi:hypothetical protein J437_LFUL002998 [Ladona fulva]|uniref:Uncharacterized protein n=1 Tax=Ladona fulva TaxID=123851 RepID=A0A8K0NUG3_LADFU|nr:hypothetical protein J437_LFUL002998 [Ladona fulva]
MMLTIHLQRPAILQQSQQVAGGANWSHRHSSTSSPTSPPSPSASARQSVQACQQKLRLQSLEMERERLKLRQQEIMRQQQEMMLRQAVVEDPTASVNSDGTAASGGTQGATAGTDPFLGGPTDHSRQESADSGLGMGNPYSLPHTPEDFLSNMDDHMDGVNGEINFKCM